MLSIYAHIPFCLKKCDYCDFFSVPTDRKEVPADEYSKTARRHLDAEVSRFGLEGREVRTVYFGGGTPSLMPPSFFEKILNGISEKFSLAEDAEISCEVNPATTDSKWFAEVKRVGVNRISLGIQSFQPELLANLGRIHSPEDAMRAIAEAEDSGFRSVGLDLIFGIPGETMSNLEDDLKIAMTFQPQHLSIYQLTLEDETPLKRKIGESVLSPVSEDNVLKQMRIALRMSERGGWKRYEISNFAKQGFECRHNLNYWNYGEYLGLGAGATSFIHFPDERMFGRRWTQVRNVEDYMAGSHRLRESEDLDVKIAMGEFCFMGLRTTGGIEQKKFEKLFGVEFNQVYGKACQELIRGGLLSDDGNRLRLTDRGIELSNQVFESFVAIAWQKT